MIEAIGAFGFDQFETAKWFMSENAFKIIRVSVVSERDKQFSTVLQNIITNKSNTVLMTAFCYDYTPEDRIFFRGKWWEIVSVDFIGNDVNPQAMREISYEHNKQAVIEIMGVEV